MAMITKIACETSADNDVEHDALEMHGTSVVDSIPRDLLSQSPAWPDAASSAATNGDAPAHTCNTASPTHKTTTATQLSASGDERAARQLTDDLLRARIAEEVQVRWSEIVAEINATLAAEQTNPDEIKEISCRAPCENSAEQHAHEAVADDSAPPRMLCQAVAPPSLADTTVELPT